MKPNSRNKLNLLFVLFMFVMSFTVLTAGTISGLVTDELEQPFDHANVQLLRTNPMNNGDWIYRNTMTSNTGTFVFNNVPVGQYRVAAVAPDYMRTFYTSPDGQILVVEVDADDEEIVGINIQLMPVNDPPPPNMTGVTGRVFNLDNEPLTRVRVGIVTLDNQNQPLPNIGTLTNNNGFYAIHNLLPGAYKTCVIDLDMAIVAWSDEFTIVAGSVTDSVNIIADLEPPVCEFGAVSGHVIGAQVQPGQMIPVGLVALDDLDTVLPGLIGHAGHMGYYMIGGVPAGDYKACVIGPNMTPVAYSEAFTVVVGQMTQNVDIIVGTIVGFSVSGTVYNADNEPVQQGVVVLRSAQNNMPPNMNHMSRSVHLNANGTYLFTNVPEGEYILSVWTMMTPVVYYPSTFDIQQAVPINVVDADLAGLDITIPVVQNYVISGYVLDAITEAPIAGIRVKTDRMGFHHFPIHDPMFNNEFSALTDATGFYSFSAPVGRYTVVAIDTTHVYRHQFYYHANNPFSATIIFLDHDYTDIDFDLIPHCDSLQYSISGVITENGEPITYPVRVVAVSSDEDWEESTITNPGGSYTINHLLPGSYFVVAYSLYTPPMYYNNQLTWDDADVVVVDGQITGINFDLVSTDVDGPNSLNGQISNNNGAIIDNAMVLLTNSQNQIIGFSRTDETGSYAIANVPTDSYTIIATKIGYATVTQQVSLNGTQIADFVLQAPTSNDDSVIPAIPAMITNYPNPFNPNTNILFTAPKDSHVSVKIYNVRGQCIKNLLNDNLKAGSHSLTWDGTDNKGNKVSSGIYMVKLQGNGFYQNRKMTLMK